MPFVFRGFLDVGAGHGNCSFQPHPANHRYTFALTLSCCHQASRFLLYRFLPAADERVAEGMMLC